jgi:hypothetical protein
LFAYNNIEVLIFYKITINDKKSIFMKNYIFLILLNTWSKEKVYWNTIGFNDNSQVLPYFNVHIMKIFEHMLLSKKVTFFTKFV